MRIPRRNPRRGEKGFTLIELLVSSLIMSVVVVTLSMVFSTIIKVWVTGLAEAEMIQNARGTLMRLSEDMQALVPPHKESIAEFIGTNNGTITNPSNMLSVADEMRYYVTTFNSAEEGSTPTRSGDITKRWVWLKKETSSDTRLQYLVDNGSISNTTLYGLSPDSQPDNYPQAYPSPGPPSFPSSNYPSAYYVSDFQVEYADTSYPAATSWHQEWDSRSTGGLTGGTYDNDKLPTMIRLTLQMSDPKKTVPPRNYTLIIRPGRHPNEASFLATGL